MNTIGRLLRFHLFGESHGRGVGVVIDGLPPGMPLDLDHVQAQLDRRRPGQSKFTTQRKEGDKVEVLSGEYRGKATGAPVALWIGNKDARSKDYGQLRTLPRPGHADWTALTRYGGFNDQRGGGHFSGRLTAATVAAGALAQVFLKGHGIETGAHLHQVAGTMGPVNSLSVAQMRAGVDGNLFKTAHADQVDPFHDLVEAARKDGDSVGGVIEFRAEGMPVGVGEPWADSIESKLAHFLFGIPAVKGVSFGAGFASAQMRGSAHNDPWVPGPDGLPQAETNHAGGILGGLSTGAPIWGHVAIKPTSSIFKPQRTVNLETGAADTLNLKGRHDPLIAIRAVPVVETAVAFALADLLLCWHAAQSAAGPWRS